MDKLEELITYHLPLGPMDALAVGVIDFNKKKFEIIEASFYEDEIYFNIFKDIIHLLFLIF